MTDSISIIQKILYKGMIDRICSEKNTYSVHLTDEAIILTERLRRFKKSNFHIESVSWETDHLVLKVRDMGRVEYVRGKRS